MLSSTAGQRIRIRRLELGLTQVRLAKAAGIGQPALSAIERGDTTQLRGQTLLGLAKAFGRAPEWVQHGIDAGADVSDPDFRAILGKLDRANRRRLLGIGRALLDEQGKEGK